MKILVFADFHGNIAALHRAVEISHTEKPNKTVVCGDIFGWSGAMEVADELRQLDGVLYLVKGNNDWHTAEGLLPTELEDYALMYHFGRNLFFTHGDVYNAMRVPPVLGYGDVLVHGHTHCAGLTRRNGLYVLNVGSLARPRDGVPCYMVLDESGAVLKSVDGSPLAQMAWGN